MIWYFENPHRYRQERQALEALGASVNWLVPGEWRIDASLRVIWDADIIVGDETFPISLRYPNHFAHSPPLVLPRGDTRRWSSHQYGAGGELCLEWGPDNWHPEITGAEMIQSAHRLLEGERPVGGQSGRVASRHDTTLGQDLRGDRLRILISEGLAGLLADIGEGEVWSGTVVCTYRDRFMMYAVESVIMADGTKWIDEAIPKTIISEGVERPIALARWPAQARLPNATKRTEFRAGTSTALGVDLPDVNYVVIAHGDRVHSYFLWADDDSACAISVIPPEASAIRIADDHAALKERKVAIVGCGSLGSKVAAMLARAQVGKFLLVDDDLMLRGNLVRHELDWRELGAHKVDALARRIDLINPAAQCDARQHRLGGQQSSGSVESLIESLAECDLIIDSSADGRVFNYLCAAAAAGKKAMLWGEIFGGGYGGLIARSRPGLEPDPASMRATIEEWCRDQGKVFPRAAEDYETRGDGMPMIADDADVTVIAAHAARLAIDTLIPHVPSRFPYSVYMIGLAGEWVFDQPFETRPIDVGKPPPAIPAAPLEQDIIDEERAHVLGLFKKFADENTADPASDSTPAP